MKSVSVCVLTLAAILIGTVYGTLYGKVDPVGFLYKYGYLEGHTGKSAGANGNNVRKAILQFQSFNGLPQTGMMDETTEKKMNAPRCGIRDVERNNGRYVTVRKWPTNQLTWRLTKYSRTSRLSRGQQRRAMSQGLNRWADVSTLVFKETRGKPLIDISFERKRHGDKDPFDGRGHVLAHAFYPQNGTTHFDDDEKWIDGNFGGTDLETVAAHEFGHALGLDHSKHGRSLMAPYYQTFHENFKLHWDDIAGIQRLYGKTHFIPGTIIPEQTTRKISHQIPNGRGTTNVPHRGSGFCNYSYKHIDAAMRIFGNDFVFVNTGSVINGRTGDKTAVQSLFPGGPKWAQAAVYSKQTGKAYLFKDKMVWAYIPLDNGNFRLVKNFPKRISNGHSHAPETAILLHNKIYLLKKGHIFEFVNEDVPPGTGSVSRALFTNIPNRVDATVSSDYAIHFIVKKKTYRMTNKPSVDIRGKPANLAFNKCGN